MIIEAEKMFYCTFLCRFLGHSKIFNFNCRLPGSRNTFRIANSEAQAPAIQELS